MYSCKYCGKEFESKHSLCGHTTRCKENPKNKITYKCKFCDREFTSLSGLHRHENQCSSNPNCVKEVYIPYSKNTVDKELFCNFCNKLCKNLNSLRQHEIRCKNNPNKIDTSNSFGNKSTPAWNKGLTKETDIRVRHASESLKIWYTNNPGHEHGGFIETSARRCKYGSYRDFYCDSSWELAFILYHLDSNIDIRRCKESFPYVFDNKIHKYYPDFVVDDIFYEIKGIYSAKDYAKIEQFPKNMRLVVVDKKSIKFYIDYAIKNYGENFTQMYDRNFPSYLDLTDTNKEYNFKITNSDE